MMVEHWQSTQLGLENSGERETRLLRQILIINGVLLDSCAAIENIIHMCKHIYMHKHMVCSN